MKHAPSECLLLLTFLAGCGSGLQTDAGRLAAPPADVERSYFPLTPGMTWSYLGERDGVPLREEVHTLRETRDILGVACTAVQENVILDGERIEVTTEWYARDDQGDIWKFGEQTLAFTGENFELTEDSWIAGQRGAQPWIEFPRDPREGVRYAAFTVLSVRETVTTPAGTFHDCMQVMENVGGPDDDDQTADPKERETPDIILYAPGTGRVTTSTATGGSRLVNVRGN